MEMQAPKGTKDMLPQDAYKWHFVEKTFRDVSKYYGMREIRTPMFEHTELFARGVGDTTDIVQKEMYTFNDKGNRSITLKPEGTAGAPGKPGEFQKYGVARHPAGLEAEQTVRPLLPRI